MRSIKKIPADYAPPYKVSVWKRPGKRDLIEIANENFVIATVETGTFKEGHAVAELIVDSVNRAFASAPSATQASSESATTTNTTKEKK